MRSVRCLRSAGGPVAILALLLASVVASPAQTAPDPPRPSAPIAPAGATVEERLWGALRQGGHVVMIRHTSTTATAGFDPPGFRLDDCATQRNLSPFGREEAQGLGAAFRARAIPVAKVLSSRWCRCLDTARLAFGAVEPWPALDSFGDDRGREPAQTREVRRLAGERTAGGNVILVTHESNVVGVTGVAPAPGEMVILAPQGDGRFQTVGRLLLSVRPPG